MPRVSDISSIVSSAKDTAVDMAGDAYGFIKNTLTGAVKGADMPIDRRARLRPQPGTEQYVYALMANSKQTWKEKLANKVLNLAPAAIASIGNKLLHTEAASAGLMSVLQATNGMVFTATPRISENHTAEYSSYDPVHSLARFNNYVRTNNVNLQISGEFFVSNATEARYLMACIHFLRSVTKMDFGRSAEDPGTPPPVLLFSAYGNYMFHDIPVIVKSVSLSYEPDVDYIQVPLNGSDISQEYKSMSFYDINMKEEDKVWVPSKLTIGIQLEQQLSGEWLTNNFDLQKFKKGELLTKGGMI